MVNDQDPIESVDESTLQNAETDALGAKNTYVAKEVSEEINPGKLPALQKLISAFKTRKKVAIPLGVVLLLAILFAIPITRYAALGSFFKRDLRVRIADNQTMSPVSGVDVRIGGQSAKTDAQGNATIPNVKAGTFKLVASKKYYKDFSSDITVGLTKAKGRREFRLEATGRQVPVRAINKITGQNIEGAVIKAADTEIQTDKNGIASLVLPVGSGSLEGSIAAKGYNNLKAKVTVSESAAKENTFSLTPSGKVYFLSKKSGKIDVVKTDLDGSNRETVLAGTGQEEDTNTVLLASRDWKYLALQSRRDSKQTKLYLISTDKDTLTEIDSGDAVFAPVGWNEHNFVYTVNRNNVPVWQSRVSGLKTFNAATQQVSVIDETNAEGSGDNEYATESFGSVYILKDSIVYSKRWYASYYSVYRLAGKRMGIYSVKSNGSGKQVIKDFDAGNNGNIIAVLSEPNKIYFSVSAASTSFYEYQGGKLQEVKNLNNESFYKFYPTHLASPGGQFVIWHEPRDGKNTLFKGSQDASSPKEIASLSEYIPYGWYSDDYLLVSKGGSELFILPVSGVGEKGQILKIADYHKANVNFQGHGYGGF